MDWRTQLAQRRPTFVIFLFSFLSGASYVMMRAYAVSVFLSRVGPESLPMAFALSAGTVILVSLGSKQLSRVVSARVRACLTWIALGAAAVALEIGCATLPDSWIVMTLLFVAAEVRGSLGTIYLATLASHEFDGAKSSRPFTIVASGAPIAGILVGFALGVEASVIGVLPVLITVAAIDIVTALLALTVPTAEASQPERPDRQHLPTNHHSDNLRRGLLSIFALKTVVLTLVTFQWELSTNAYYQGNEAGMVAYFAFFYAASDLLIVAAQWSVAGRLLDRFGLGIGLFGLPLMMCLAGIGALAAGSATAMLFVYTIAKGMNVIRRSLHDPALTAAYSALNPDVRSDTIVLNKGIVKPLAEAAASGMLLLLGLFVRDINVTGLWVFLLLPWLYLAFTTAKWYRKASQETALKGKLAQHRA